jgi:protein SCO1
MSRKRVFYIVFFFLLVVGFFITISYAIPEFVKGRVNPISKIETFSFINQDGARVTEQAIRGKVAAVNFFFTTCKSICPRMNGNLKPIYDEFKNENDFVILSHTSDPARDSAAVLKHYADSMQVDTRKWIFLTGRKDSLYAAARHSYKIDDPQNFVQNIDDDFLHTQFVALVNKKGEVVHIYDGIKPSEMKEMSVKIRELLKD